MTGERDAGEGPPRDGEEAARPIQGRIGGDDAGPAENVTTKRRGQDR